MPLINIAATKQRIVPPNGPKKCLMAICGQAPGEQEEMEGKPFVGPNGDILNTKLHMNGIARHQCYITNLSKERPGSWWRVREGLHNGLKYKKPSKANDFSIFWSGNSPTQYLIECREALLQELTEIDTSVVLAAGGDALWALTGHKEISKYRGSILPCTLPNGRVIKVVGTWHPANIWQPMKKVSPGGMAHIIQFDIGKAKQQAAFPEYKPPVRNLIINPTVKTVHEFCMDNINKPKVAYDIETAPGDITCVSLAFSRHEAISIPTTTRYWKDITTLLRVLQMVSLVLTKEGMIKAAQFMAYDFQYLFRFFSMMIAKPWYDNAIAQHSCYPELPKGHDFLCSIYTDEPYYKDELKIWLKDINDWDKLYTYNARDGASEFEVMEETAIEMDDLGVRHTFDYMMELMEPLLFIMLHGIKWDSKAAEVHRKIYKEKFERDSAIIKEKYGDVNPRSPKQVLALLEQLNIKPIIRKGKPTTDKKALEKLAVKSPELKKIISVRNAGKFIANYIDVGLDPVDNRFRFSMNQTRAVTGRLSSSESNFWGVGNNCLLPDAEVLTPTGWVKFKDFEEGTKAMQWSPDGKLSWCTPILHKTIYTGKLVKANSTIHRNFYTPNHKIPKLTKRNFLHNISAEQASNESNWFIPLSGSFNGGTINIPSIRLLAVIQADGSIEKNLVRFGFKKQRKIDRFIWLMNILEIDYHEIKQYGDVRKFVIPTHVAKPYVDLLRMRGKKHFGDWLLWLTEESRYELLDEIRYWDSHIINDSFEYYTSIENNAEWVATLAHLCKCSATLTITVNNWPSNKPLYRVNIKPRTKAYQSTKMYSTENYHGDVYCLTTPSSYFLVRYGNRIVVTGNSENWPAPIRDMLIPDEGMVFTEPDLVGAEAVVVAYLSEDPLLMKLFEEGSIEPEEGFKFTNVHSFTAYLIWHKTQEEIEKEKKLLTKAGRNTESMYFRGKKTRHTANYKGTWVTLSEELKIAAADAKTVLRKFHMMSPNVERWHREVEMQLKSTRTITTCLGRRRTFFDSWGRDLLAAAVAYEPQEIVVHVLNLGLINIYNKLCKPFKHIALKNQVHDSVLIQHPPELTSYIHEQLPKLMNIPLTIKGHNFSIPIDIKTSSLEPRVEEGWHQSAEGRWDWGKLKSVNNWRDIEEVKDVRKL